ncbi:MAG: O-antigen ligase family protein [Candidatus Buchananbacteria bacterium]
MFLFDLNWQIQHFLNQFFWPINFLLVAILVILAYLSYKKPIYAVGLTIVLLPTYLFRSKIWFPTPSGAEGLPFTFLEVCIWVTFLGWLINSSSYKLKALNSKLKNYRWPILLILLSATISVFISPDKAAAAGLWKAYFVEPILFFVVLVNIIKTQKDKDVILWSLGISTLAISLLAIYQKFTGFGIAEASWILPAQRRVTSLFTSPNAVGLYLGPITAIYLGWLISELPKVRFANRTFGLTILKLLIIIPAILAILFTVSQGTWLGLLAAIVFFVFFGWNKKITALIVLILIISCLTVPPARHQILELLTFKDASSQNRLFLWQTGWQYLTDNSKNSVLGAGLLGFAQIQNAQRDPLTLEPLLYPHNIILNFWLEIGLTGLLAFGWLIIKFFKQGFANYQLITLGLMSAMVAILIHGLIDVPYFKNDLAVLFWVIIGLL